MAEFLSPGIFIQEVSNQGQTVQAVGTSTMAVVGFTLQGPTNQAVLISSTADYVRNFGGNTPKSLVPLSVTAYFSNGGTRAYVVRVVPSDAVAATSAITQIESQTMSPAMPSTFTPPQAFTATAATIPIDAGTVTVLYNIAGTAILVEAVVWTPAPNGVLLGPFTGTLASHPITNDDITIHWTETSVAKSATLTGTNTVGGVNAANISSATVNRTTGVITITFAATHPPDTASLTIDYTPVGAAVTLMDNGSGGLLNPPAFVTAVIVYTTGVITVTFSAGATPPYNGDVLVASESYNLWGLAAANQGLWGNKLQFVLQGSTTDFVYGTTSTPSVGTFAKFNVFINQYDTTSASYVTKESYSEVSFTDPTDPMYVLPAINNASSLVVMTDLSHHVVPTSFNGTINNGVVLAAAAGTSYAGSVMASLIPAGIVKGSFQVLYTISAVGYTAIADVNGVITGTNIDSTKTNTIDYATGAFILNFTMAPTGNITAKFVANPTTTQVTYSFTGGADGTIALITEATISNSSLQPSKFGMYAFDRVDEFMQLIIPDFAGNVPVMVDQIAYADGRRDIFNIFTTPKGMSAQQAVDFRLITFGKFDKYAAMYWPWVVVSDPNNNGRPLTMPPLGAIAGVYARTDTTRNVGKAPGGTVDGALLGILGLETNPGQAERDTVYPSQVNPLINSPQTGLAVWGVRTLSADSSWRYVSTVRLFIFVEKSTFNSTQFLVFEPISNQLYSQVKTTLNSFLLNLYNQGYFAGTTAAQAFFVICDATNNPPAVVNAGQVVVDVGISPTIPGEFIIFRFQQRTLS